MRTKSETKRLKILEAASDAFRVTGFERTSMSDICAQAGFSRATLYSYFPSKEELFLEVMLSASQTQVDAIMNALDLTTPNIEESLNRFGQKLLAFIHQPEILALRRLAIAEATRSEFGEVFYARSRKQGEIVISNFLQAAMDAGKLRQAEARVAAAHFMALLESELIEMMYQAHPAALDPAQVARMTASAVGVFMAAYGPGR